MFAAEAGHRVRPRAPSGDGCAPHAVAVGFGSFQGAAGMSACSALPCRVRGSHGRAGRPGRARCSLRPNASSSRQARRVDFARRTPRHRTRVLVEAASRCLPWALTAPAPAGVCASWARPRPMSWSHEPAARPSTSGPPHRSLSHTPLPGPGGVFRPQSCRRRA